MLVMAAAGFDLIGTNSRVVAKYDRTKLLNQTRFALKEYVACRATEATVCGGRKQTAPMFKNNGPTLSAVRFLSAKQKVPENGDMVLALRPRCTGYGLNYDYLYVRRGQPALDPVSRLPTTWRPLFKDQLCSRGAVATRWPD